MIAWTSWARPKCWEKKTGLDVYKNEVTLPLLYLFSELGTADGVSHENIKRLAVEKGAVDRAMQKAREYAEGAVEELRGLVDSPYSESLRQLADYCLDRVK